ncbi:acyl-CoA thioesterase [Flavobacteriaceae bacterium F89]|uniref:Acyl-CoA thioesterase n=1 Tax=Cerina litoralis TaxID=2874477 RepID=A0AAE3ERW1_9FLAO|nr:acyl-CoA thioesterase [Cerina litoralis]MCG2459258.1 acyl-CoA thioesterase [Cerina litoralis]
MIYYWLHIFYLFMASKLFWKKLDVTTDLIRKHRVNILDCDSLHYMANSRYLYYMDFVRIEKLLRSSLYENTVKRGIFPVLGSQKIIYKKPLRIGSKFTITLALEGWDEKWFYHRQIFTQNDQVCAIGYTKAALWKGKKAQDLKPILKDCGVTTKTMQVPPSIAHLFENDYQLLKT